MKELNKRVGQVVRELREQQGLTQDELAEAAGIHEKHMGVIERGLQGITLEYVCKVSKGLNIGAAEFVGKVFESGKVEDSKEKIIKDIHALLKTQSTGNLKALRKIVSHCVAARTKRKSVFLLEAKAEKNKKNGIAIITKKI